MMFGTLNIVSFLYPRKLFPEPQYIGSEDMLNYLISEIEMLGTSILNGMTISISLTFTLYFVGIVIMLFDF